MQRIFVLLIICCITLPQLAVAADDSLPQKQVTGSLSLKSHYVENGISQSNMVPAIQGSFWFAFGQQSRLGISGTNTAYQNSSDGFNLRATAELKFNFSNYSYGLISYSDSKYFKSGNHNGNITGINLIFPEFRINYSRNSNWEGSQSSAPRYSFQKMFKSALDGWDWDNEIGYCSPEVSTVSPFYDVRTALGKRYNVVFVEGSITATSAASQLSDRGDVYFILSAKTEF